MHCYQDMVIVPVAVPFLKPRLWCLQFQGQHPLRERAKKLDQGILVIRFEMPFNVWCAGCGHLIGKGVRFNAEKKAIGNYFSTKIWSFSMTSPCCQEHIEVQTDPKNHEYVVVAGARRKVRPLLHSHMMQHRRQCSMQEVQAVRTTDTCKPCQCYELQGVFSMARVVLCPPVWAGD